MKSIFSDPVQWTASAVGTKTRFALTLGLLSMLIGMAVFDAAASGLRSAVALSLFVVWIQFLLLFGMRAMYLHVVGNKASPGKMRPIQSSMDTPTTAKA